MHAEILAKGEFRCFPDDLRDAQGRPVHAEVSAVVWDGARLLMASDKEIPGDERSPVFTMHYDAARGPLEETLEYVCTPTIRNAAKYEDFALTPDGQFIIGTTGFDRFDHASTALDAYNAMIIWPCGSPDRARAIGGTPKSAGAGSVALRQSLSAVLRTDYFKVEGLAAIPSMESDRDGTLLVGVRERGEHKDRFDYVSEIVAAGYRMVDGDLRFIEEFSLIHSFVAHECAPDLQHQCGLSSLELDPFAQRLFLLTSYEMEDSAGNPDLGGYLWELSLNEFHQGEPPRPVRHGDGRLVEFHNKAEGLAVLADDRLLIVFDNDRHLEMEADRGREQRQANEALYTLLAIEEG